MYTFSNSLLEPTGDYKVETYSMQIFGCDASIEIDLYVFGENNDERYAASFEIMKDYKTASGMCAHRPTKEEMFLGVESMAIEMLDNENTYWE